MYIYFYSKSRGYIEKYLSNFTHLDRPIKWKTQRFPTVEHAFQASKYLYTEPERRPDLFKRFAVGQDYGKLPAAKVKSLGGRAAMKRLGVTLDMTRWNQVNRDIMKSLIRLRVKTDKLFREILKKANKDGMRFFHFERSGKRSYWGGFFPAEAKRVHEPKPAAKHFVGRNELGKILTEVSREI